MSLRTYCPGCDNELSAIRAAFERGEGCPNCGLSATAAEEIMSVRARLGDEKLKSELEAALKRADQYEQQYRLALYRLSAVQKALAEGQNALSADPPYPLG